MSAPEIGDRIVSLLRERGEMQNSTIVFALRDFKFREIDGALQRLRRAGRIESLPRISGSRPFALWRVANGAPLHPEDQK